MIQIRAAQIQTTDTIIRMCCNVILGQRRSIQQSWSAWDASWPVLPGECLYSPHLRLPLVYHISRRLISAITAARSVNFSISAMLHRHRRKSTVSTTMSRMAAQSSSQRNSSMVTTDILAVRCQKSVVRRGVGWSDRGGECGRRGFPFWIFLGRGFRCRVRFSAR